MKNLISKKMIIGIVFVAILCIGCASVFMIKKYNTVPSEEDLIRANTLENILQKKDSLYIEQKYIKNEQEENSIQIFYFEYADGSVNKYERAVNSPIEELFYNGAHYRLYDNRLYAVCEKSVQSSYARIDVFSSMARYPDSAGTERPKPQTLKRDGNEYILSYSWKTYYETNVSQHDLTFRFAKDLSCKEIKLVEYGATNIYTFSYGNKKEYFDKVKEIPQEESIEINVTNLNESKRSFGPCKIPIHMYVWIEHITVFEIYLDSACTEPYTIADSLGPGSWFTTKPVDQDLSLYLKETYVENGNGTE